MNGGIASVVSVVILGNNPPLAPTITEPAFHGRIVNAEDVHMETAPFSDPDPADIHTASDWEIWTAEPGQQRVWAALGVTGLAKVHIHLGDGVFMGSHAGRRSLLPSRSYQLRVRHRDSSGVQATQWSPYSLRAFGTAGLSTVLPLEFDDIADSPAPLWQTSAGSGGGGGSPIILPGSGQPAMLRAESPTGGAMLVITGGVGQNIVFNPGTIAHHAPLRLVLTAGSQALNVPATDLSFTDHEGTARTVYLPAANLAAGQSAYYWVSSNGSTFVGAAGQSQPSFSTLARTAAVPWGVQPGFEVGIAATGFTLPVNIAFVPNAGPNPTSPRYYVSELYGTIKVVRRNGTVGTYASGLLNFDPGGAFPGSGEQGLTGLAVDPATGDVLASLLYDAAPPSGPHFPKVVRFRSTDGGQTASSQSVVLDMANEPQGPSHQVSNLTISPPPDNKLYIHVGDGFESAAALNLDSFRGKVLRANLDGSAAANNPFYNAGNGITARDYVYSYGHRNPFGGAWRAADSKQYQVENGPGTDRITRVDRGVSYGWDGSEASMSIGAIHTWGPSVAPVNIAFVQPSTFGGSRFPSSMMGHAFVSESGPTWGEGPQVLGKKISEFVLDAAGNVVAGPFSLVEYNGAGRATCVGLAAGPDGLYFSDLYKDQGYQTPVDTGANILRVRHVGEADFSADVASGPAPLTVRFSDLSTAPSPSAWMWVFGDGAWSTDPSPTHTYTREGRYNVRMRVTGAAGAVIRQRNAFIQVGKVARVALIVGAIPPAAADLVIRDHLLSKGFLVDLFDDEQENRAPASSLSNHYDVAMVSSTVDAASIGGEFRTSTIPLVFWEQAILRSDREPLSQSGASRSGATTISIIAPGHPVIQGLPAGNLTVFQASSAMSVGTGTIAPGATVLARRAGSTDAAIIAAEQGSQLLGGITAPARRVFLFFDDAGYASATAAARAILDRAACWAGRLDCFVATQPVSQVVQPGDPVTFQVSAGGAGPMSYQWRRNGVPLGSGGRISGAATRSLTIIGTVPADAGSYDVVITSPCNQATSQAAILTPGCYANCDGSTSHPALNIYDFLCFQSRFAAGETYANCDGSTTAPVLTVADFVCFRNSYIAGCP